MRFFVLLKKYSKNILIIANLAVSILLLLSYLSIYISPVDYSVFAFLGLIYPYLLVINILFIMIWLVSRSWLFAISAVSILIGLKNLNSFVQINHESEQTAKIRKNIKVLSYNVRVFNLWKWSSDNDIPNRTFSYIKRQRPDIVCLQEFFSKQSKGKNAKDSLLKKSTLKYAHVSFTKIDNKTYNYGIATFSAFPIVNKGNVKINKNDNFCIYSDVKIGNDTLRIVNVHLESIHLGYDDYQLIENIESRDSIDVRGLKNIVKKLRKGYRKRALQSERIANFILESPYEIILCGDFNDTPVSYAYNTLNTKLRDSFRESGNGIGSTYINKYSAFRIDYILHSPSLTSSDFSVPNVKFSDHYPVECNIQILEKD